MNLKLKHFLLLFLFALVIFYPSLKHLYLDIDEVLWAEFAHAVLNGCPPYVCVVGEKPPLLYLTYAGIFKLFGANNYLALHVVHIFWVTCTAFLLNLTYKKSNTFSRPGLDPGSSGCNWIPAFAGMTQIFPGLFYILLFALPEFRTLAATGESFMNLFLVASFYCLYLTPPLSLQRRGCPKDGRGLTFIAGLLVGLASLYRHQAAIQLLVYSFVIFCYKSPLPLRERVRERGQFTFHLLSGFCLTWIVIVGILYLWGSWPAFWDWSILHNFGYIKNGAKAPGVWMTALENLGLFFGKTIVFWVLVFCVRRGAPVCAPAIDGRTHGYDPTLLYLITALLAACPGFRFFPHYFIQAFPPLALLATLALQKIKFPLWAKTGLILSLSLALFQNITTSKTLENDSTQDYSSLNKIVGEYIQQNSSSEDKIAVWGWGQGIYAYANRRMGTRYIASDFLTGRIPASDANQYLSTEEALKFSKPNAWKNYFEDLEKNKPLYFINTSPTNMHDYQKFPPEAYPDLKNYLDENYALANRIDKIEIFKLK